MSRINRVESGSFAEACYNDNTLAELSEPHAPSDADAADCATWNLTPEQWSEQIELARRVKLAEALEDRGW